MIFKIEIEFFKDHGGLFEGLIFRDCYFLKTERKVKFVIAILFKEV